MTYATRTTHVVLSAILTLLAGWHSSVIAIEAPDSPGRFDSLEAGDPAAALDAATMPAESLPSAARTGWDGFRAAHGAAWAIWIDRRSGAPLLVEGQGIPWPIKAGATIDSIAATLRTFMAAKRSLLMADDSELVLDRDASGLLQPDVWQIVFGRVVSGVPVAGERYQFTIGHGRLISFGSPRWSRIDVGAIPEFDEVAARARLTAYMGLTQDDAAEDVMRPRLQFIPLLAGPSKTPGSGYYSGAIGSGYSSALVWRFSLHVEKDPGNWVALVDAHTGAIRSFVDSAKYARLKGGIFPRANSQTCPDGCEQPNYPMPFATVSINASNPTTSAMGIFNCSPAGATATTTLSGPYVKIVNTCGAISQSVTCSADLDLGSSPSIGSECTVQPGASPGNTYAARTAFFHLNRAFEHVRSWLPTVSWLTSQLTATVNSGLGCAAMWVAPSIEIGMGGGFCNNLGANAGILYHEWGHGLDYNDGGGEEYDNPAEGYADIVALLQIRDSCMSRGLYPGLRCGPNGNLCLTCEAQTDFDYNGHELQTPATPMNYVVPFCPPSSFGAPCGYHPACEKQLVGETIWDLATRDLPSTGMSLASAWEIVERLWYTSRLGSTGNAYNCALPDSDSCLATSWYQKMRAVDDDDGNLANGTPHAAQLFAAFNRHKLACGAVDDPTNQSTATCPVIPAPTLTSAPRPGANFLSWNAVPNASSYRLLRNDLGCQWAFTRVSDTAATSVTDTGLANGFPINYRVQGLSGNAACDGAVSSCVTVTPQPFAAALSVDASSYACASAVITVTVVDGNVGAPPTASLTSTTETTPQTISLIRNPPGGIVYKNTITTTTAPPAADGLLSVRNGDTITVTYNDASDGGGGVNIPRVTTATATCVTPGVRPVPDGLKPSRTDGTGASINLKWDVTTCSSSDHHLLYGDLATVSSSAIGGAACNLGTSGTNIWAGVPAGNVWFVIVGDDDGTTEGSWGTDGNGAQRGGVTVSGQCGMTTRDNAGTCP
jgi:hypothetical protein